MRREESGEPRAESREGRDYGKVVCGGEVVEDGEGEVKERMLRRSGKSKSKSKEARGKNSISGDRSNGRNRVKSKRESKRRKFPISSLVVCPAYWIVKTRDHLFRAKSLYHII
jgi:hypothetical protein